MQQITFDTFNDLVHSLQSEKIFEKSSGTKVQDKTLDVHAPLLPEMGQDCESNEVRNTVYRQSPVTATDLRYRQENASEDVQCPVGSALRAVWSRKDLE